MNNKQAQYLLTHALRLQPRAKSANMAGTLQSTPRVQGNTRRVMKLRDIVAQRERNALHKLRQMTRRQTINLFPGAQAAGSSGALGPKLSRTQLGSGPGAIDPKSGKPVNWGNNNRIFGQALSRTAT